MFIRAKTLLSLAIFTLIAMPYPAKAQDLLPTLPDPIQNLVNEGAQIRYLGNDFGLDAWITIKNGREQYFYVTPDKKAIMMGVLFNDQGKLITAEQVRKLRSESGDVLDMLADDFGQSDAEAENMLQQQVEFKSPSERLFFDIENSNWVALGDRGAPIMYSFIDPQCPHCHTLIENMKDTYLDNGRVQLRMIPIGFRDETRAQAAFLLATPNPAQRFYNHLDGDENALPARAEINQQGVQRNMAIMQSWKLDVTPLIIYRARDGSVKIIRGNPRDLPGLVSDLGART